MSVAFYGFTTLWKISGDKSCVSPKGDEETWGSQFLSLISNWSKEWFLNRLEIESVN
jgi:hypothetical protein